MLRLVADARHAGRRLDDVAVEWLSTVLGASPSRGAVRRLIMAGALRVRGRPLRAPGRAVEAGWSLEAHVRPGLLQRPIAPPPFDATSILYEDDVLIVVDKPPGLPTVPTADPARPHLVGLVEQLLSTRAGGAAPRPLGVHQRLDRDTSGVVLFVKDPAANASLAAQFAGRTVEKTYLALTARPPHVPTGPWRVDADVEPPPAPGAASAARPAVTDLLVLEVFADAVLVEARPRTGRKHQIRIHLAAAGLPVVGDTGYGGDARAARTMLHAARLDLRHPVSGEALSVTSPLPADFRACLERLRQARAPARPRTRPR